MCATPPPVQPLPDNSPQAIFQELLPRILTQTRITFRGVACPGLRADHVAETMALAWKQLLRLHQRGKDVMQFPTRFVLWVARGVRQGRRLCGHQKAKDVLSAAAQLRHCFKVEALPSGKGRFSAVLVGTGDGQNHLDAYSERLRDNTVTPPPEAAAFRIDFPNFVGALSARDRRLALFLSLGHTAKQAAAEFGLSQARVTQLRQRWYQEWHAGQGDDIAGVETAPVGTAAR